MKSGSENDATLVSVDVTELVRLGSTFMPAVLVRGSAADATARAHAAERGQGQTPLHWMPSRGMSILGTVARSQSLPPRGGQARIPFPTSGAGPRQGSRTGLRAPLKETSARAPADPKQPDSMSEAEHL
jgi:hypothetical protein